MRVVQTATIVYIITYVIILQCSKFYKPIKYLLIGKFLCTGQASRFNVTLRNHNHIPSKVIIFALFETKDVDIVIITIVIAINSNNRCFLVLFWEEFLICIIYRFRQTLIY